VMDLLPERKVVFLAHDITIKEALEILDDRKISSAPVLNLETKSLLGIIDMFDVVTLLLGIFPNIDQVTTENLEELEYAGKRFVSTSVGEALELSRKYTQFPLSQPRVERTTILIKLVEILWTGVHRVPVVNNSSNIINIITQSDVLAFMAQNVHLIPQLAHKTIDEVGFMKEKIITATGDTNTTALLMQFNSKRISAVPVVDSEGKLIANFSTSDLKGLEYKDLADLMLPVLKFLQKRAMPEEAFACEKSLHPLTVTKQTTFEDCIFKMVATRVHRLWVVDPENKPIGVISISDFMRAFLS